MSMKFSHDLIDDVKSTSIEKLSNMTTFLAAAGGMADKMYRIREENFT